MLEGGAGADRLDGSKGKDTASYAGAASGVTADLGMSANNSEEAAGDTYRSIENLLGSDFDDRLIGDRFNNVLRGGEGADTLLGRNGNDQLVGGLGPDIVSGGRGRDSHLYRTIEEGGDVIVDYVVKDDTLVFSASGFGGGLVEGQDVVPGVTFISGPAPHRQRLEPSSTIQMLKICSGTSTDPIRDYRRSRSLISRARSR